MKKTTDFAKIQKSNPKITSRVLLSDRGKHLNPIV